MRVESEPVLKKRRFNIIDPMEYEFVKEKLAAAKQNFGRELRVFETTSSSPTSSNVSNTEEPDDFYEFSAEDYHRILATKKDDKFLKTKKLRDAEEAARRARITKAVIRVRFPDNHTLEATFHPSETIQSLIDLLVIVVARPDLPFYIYTTPPKKQLRDMSQNFYAAGFVPGAIVYFSYDLPQGENTAAPIGSFLKEEVMSLKGLEVIAEQSEPSPEAEVSGPSTAPAQPVQERKPSTDKKTVKPKWLKM